MTPKPPRSPSQAAPPDSNEAALDAWADKIFTATLPSGHVQQFRLPSLGQMVAMGELPADLQEIAVAEWSQPGIAADLAAAPFLELRRRDSERGSEPTPEELEDAKEKSVAVARLIARLNRHLVALAMTNPAARPEQLERMPFRDLELLSLLVNRGTGVDAAGRHVGVVPLDTFQVVAHAHRAECDGTAGCPGCQEAGRELAAVS